MFTLPPSSSVLVGGSRSLVSGSPAEQACFDFVGSIIIAGLVLHVGCATGADQSALASCSRFSSASSRIFSAFAQSGAGSFSGSAVFTAQQSARAGLSVTWLAGGPLSVPLVARLMARSVAALRGCSAAVFFAPGIGSLKVARHALRSGVPVLVACVGCPVAPVLAVPSVRVQWLGQWFWLFAPAVQSPLF